MENKFTNFLGDGTQNIVQSCYDNFVKSNAELRGNAGLKATITRMTIGECCEWCAQMADTYEYGKEPEEVYRRHKNCDCVVIYKSEKGTYQDAHNKQEYENRQQVISEITKKAVNTNKITDPARFEAEIAAKLAKEPWPISAAPVNKFGQQITFSDKIPESSKAIITRLANEYATRLGRVVVGSAKSAGSVDTGGFTMHLSSKKNDIPIHEFGHTLAQTYSDKIGLTHDTEFWKEIKKIRRSYMKDVGSDTSRWISSYEHSSKNPDEFMCEAFAMVKMREFGMEKPKHYGNDYTYAEQVVRIIDKYFKK